MPKSQNLILLTNYFIANLFHHYLPLPQALLSLTPSKTSSQTKFPNFISLSPAILLLHPHTHPPSNWTWLSTQSYLCSVSTGSTRYSALVTLARPPLPSSLQITNRSFTYASPHLWNQLPSSFRQPHCVHSPPGSPHPAHINSTQSPPSLSSPIAPSTFHSRLKTHLFHKSFSP